MDHRSQALRWTTWAAVVLLVAAVLAAASCGGDPYSGTWTRVTMPGDRPTNALQIRKDDDDWVITDPLGQSGLAVEQDGGLRLLEPLGDNMRLERKGDHLVLLTANGDFIAEYERRQER